MADNFSVAFEFPTNIVDAEVGSVVYLNTAGTLYGVFDTTAPSGSFPSAVVQALNSSSGYGRLVHSGNIPASISGLSAAAASAVIADQTTGKLARKAEASLSSTDWFCGYADALGNVSFVKPFRFIEGQSGRVATSMVSSPSATTFDCLEIDHQAVVVTSSGSPHTTIVNLPGGYVGRRVSIKDGSDNAGAGFPTQAVGNPVPTAALIEQFTGASTYASSLTMNVSSAAWELLFDGTNWRLV